jgi:hypothetical protein
MFLVCYTNVEIITVLFFLLTLLLNDCRPNHVVVFGKQHFNHEMGVIMIVNKKKPGLRLLHKGGVSSLKISLCSYSERAQ